jgi:hypothetical protein
MLKTVVFWLLLQPLLSLCPDGNGAGDCPTISGLHKTAKTSDSYTIAWNTVGQALEYEVKCIRKSDGSIVSSALTPGTAHTFNNLSPGSYLFYVSALCGNERSGFIGIDDVIEI